ncbi:carbohydrate-binding protein [Clostridium scatologenes]|uniref:Chitin-binding type-3 domain-containing protein n=1 Tax=Clostridium scatologenes TaxID=1548 RepID=A0A0E3K1L5_CLOSL|nr:carbohydrate-binding protein [Clostridium scatologenes]AKA70120.1 hypothetical protein CSCA_2995 [Clostridium scatologenes]
MSNFYSILNTSGSGVEIDDTIRDKEKVWSSFKTGEELDKKATKEDLVNIKVPTKISDLANDSKFQNDTQVIDSITTSINDLKDGVATDGDTLAKLKNLIINSKLRNWRANIAYKSGDYVVYNSCIYETNISHTSGSSFDTDYLENGIWTLWVGGISNVDAQNLINTAITNLKDGVPTDGNTLAKLRNLIMTAKVKNWRANTAYTSGEVIIYNNSLYMCLMTTTSAAAFSTDLDNGIWNLVVSGKTNTDIQNLINTSITTLKDGVITDGDTLNKLRNLIMNATLKPWKPLTQYKAESSTIQNNIIVNYTSANLIEYNNCIYTCLVSHNSGTDFTADLNAGNWKFLIGNTLEIDDITTSPNTLWSSSRTVQEIQNLKPKIKLAELQDVDTNNVGENYVITYSPPTAKWIAVPSNSIPSSNNGYKFNQITKLGVNGTTANPEKISIPYATIDFNLPKLNVLKFKSSETNLITIEGDFNANEQTGYTPDDYITFDGTAKLRTTYGNQMTKTGDLNQGTEWSFNVDKSAFKEFVGFSVDDNAYPNLSYKAIPFDRLLIQQQDYNLSSAEHIDYFNLNATGTNMRIVSSTDDGVTWQYFDGATFQNISSLTVENVKQHGNSINEFNAMQEKWNYVTASKKIRFAYLLQMDSISDIEQIDSLTMQYDGRGVWREAIHGQEYDVDVDNTEIKVYMYIKGDIKINY